MTSNGRRRALSTAELSSAAAALSSGEVVCLPTESLYALAVDARNPDALARLSELKQRPEGTPFGLMAANLRQARSLCAAWPHAADELARRYWPGALTLVVSARSDLPEPIVGPGGGVGVRVPDHPWPVAIARRLRAPITATSANLAGQPGATDCASVRADFGSRIAVYLDAGPARGTSPSTLIQVAADGQLSLLRQGALVVPGVG